MSRDSRNHMYSSVPIPTYEEATSGPSSSSQHLGTTQISHDAQRQELLRGSAHRQPTVESARSSLDSDLSVPEMVQDGHDRRHIEEMDYLEPGDGEVMDRRQARRYHRARLRSKLAQSLSNLSATLGSIRLPSLRRLYDRVPNSTSEPPQEPLPSWSQRFRQSLVLPKDYRMSVPTFARLCALVTIAAFVWFLFSSNFFPRRRGMMATMFEPESVRAYMQANIDGDSIRASLEHLSSFAHEAGSEGDFYMAKWIHETWKAACSFDESDMLSYYVLANYPYEEGRSVTIKTPVKMSATLAEAQTNDLEITLPWHVHSANGVAEGPLRYAGDGSRESFDKVIAHGIDMNGTIALFYSSSFNNHTVAQSIRFAFDAGCVGALVFDGENISDEGNPIPASIHRANAALSSWILGDPLTPGRPSEKGAQKDRDAAKLALPFIPSLPLSWNDGKSFLHVLGVDKDYDIVTNQAKHPIVVEMSNENDVSENQQTWQVVARISGAEAAYQKVVVGAPRDAWCFDTAHSGSASAILTELIRVFGELRRLGWLPLRTIEFVSWDASTFNAAGSTEYVEDHMDALRDEGITYVNVASGMSGLDFTAAGSPMLQKSLMRAMKRVTLPDMKVNAAEGFDPTVDHFLGEVYASVVSPLLRPLRMTDSAAFTYIAGMPTLDIAFTGQQGRWVEGTCYDTLDWAQHANLSYEDDSYESWFHESLAQVWGLLVLDLASAPLIPLDARTYADHISTELEQFKKDVSELLQTQNKKDISFNFDLLEGAGAYMKEAAETFHAYEEDWSDAVTSSGQMESLYHNRLRMSWNERLVKFEKALIDKQQHKDDGSPGGLKGRSQFRHVLTAPKKWSHGTLFLPSVWDYLDDAQWEKAQNEIDRVAAIIREAAKPLSSG